MNQNEYNLDRQLQRTIAMLARLQAMASTPRP